MEPRRAAAMPKRGCPFADAAPLQLKVRVGQRELSRGVCAERLTREIFGECGEAGPPTPPGAGDRVARCLTGLGSGEWDGVSAPASTTCPFPTSRNGRLLRGAESRLGPAGILDSQEPALI